MESRAEQRRVLEERKQTLLEEYAAANDQIAGELSSVNRGRLQKQVEGISRELEAVETQIKHLEDETADQANSKTTAQEPQFENPRNQQLAKELESAETRLEEALVRGDDTTAIKGKILDLKRELRTGGRLRPGDTLVEGRYKLLEVLGQGGFAVVWKALDRRRHQLVAIKVLHGQYGYDRSRRQRFFRGSRLMASLQHQGIVRVLEEELEDDEYHFFVMEYLSGGDLHRAILGGELPLRDRLGIILSMGEALSFAHQHGVIHRDIKPANILLDENGRPRLTDFDLVRAEDTTGMTRTGMMGTIIFAAPELMFRPQDAAESADIFSLAMTAVFSAHGAILPPQVLRDAAGFIDRCEVPEEIKSVLKEGVAWEVADRYPSVKAFCQALQLAMESCVAVEAEPGGTKKQAGDQDRSEGIVEAEREEYLDTVTRERKTLQDSNQQPVPFRDRFLESDIEGPEMVWLPGGTFIMGDDKSERDNEKPAHLVSLDHFSVGKYPLTVGEFRRFVETTGYRTEAETGDGAWVVSRGYEKVKDASWRKPYFDQADDHPVVNISWNDAQEYCRWLSGQIGQEYRLLTEAQWEFACRAGSETAYCFGDDPTELKQYAWYGEYLEIGSTHPVGRNKPNRWGLYDLHGNVWEWVNDWYLESCYEQLVSATRSGASGTTNDSKRVESGSEDVARGSEQITSGNPSGPELGSYRVVRGGAWDFSAGVCRSAYRFSWLPGARYSNLGFRLSRIGPLSSYPFALGPRPQPASQLGEKPHYQHLQGFRDRLSSGGEAPEMVYLKGGTFRMGDGQGIGRENERPVHQVTLDAFAVGRTPVTVGEYLRFCEAADKNWPEWLEKGSEFHIESGKNDFYSKCGMGRNALDFPIVGIAWQDAVSYCQWLSEQTGERYELLTEAQWEYACQGGSESTYCFGDNEEGLGDYAWYSKNASDEVHPSGKKRANGFGLYDMHGNVWEWVNDWYSERYYEQWAVDARREPSGTATDNPSGPKSGSGRVVRGGAWRYNSDLCRSAYRGAYDPSSRSNRLGFRLSRRV